MEDTTSCVTQKKERIQDRFEDLKNRLEREMRDDEEGREREIEGGFKWQSNCVIALLLSLVVEAFFVFSFLSFFLRRHLRKRKDDKTRG